MTIFIDGKMQVNMRRLAAKGLNESPSMVFFPHFVSNCLLIGEKVHLTSYWTTNDRVQCGHYVGSNSAAELMAVMESINVPLKRLSPG